MPVILVQSEPPAVVATAAGVPLAPSQIIWLKLPRGDDIARAFPWKAKRDSVDGFASISCTAAADGGLSNCAVVAEGPAGFGFGQAALKMVPSFKMAQSTKDGQTASGRIVTIPIRFTLPH